MCRITRLRCQVCQPRWTAAELTGTSTTTPSRSDTTAAAAATAVVRTYRFRPCPQMKRLASSSSSSSSDSHPTCASSSSASRPRAAVNGQHVDTHEEDGHKHVGHNSTGGAEHILPPATRLHCPKLIWPLPADGPLAAVDEFICDMCLHAGTTHYHWTVQEKQLEALRLSTYGQRAVPPDDDQRQSGETSSRQQLAHDPKSFFVLPAASQVKGSFPPEWDTLVSNEMRTQIFTEYIQRAHAESTHSNTFMRDALPEPDWGPRLSEAPHRHLTLWIPCCKLCREPALLHYSKNSDRSGHDKFAGLEFEPSSVLWKWLSRLPERPGVATTISTGFLYKPCAACVERETELRLRVRQFLDDSPDAHAWAVWHWLLVRGSGQADFWQHGVSNIGLPNGQPWDIKFFMQLMAEGWWYRTGVAWHDVGDLGPPRRELVLATSHHRGTTLVGLRQWRNLVKLLMPADKFPPPPSLKELGGMLSKAIVTQGRVPHKTPRLEEQAKPVRVIRRSIPAALTELQISTTRQQELPFRYKTTLHNASKKSNRFVTFKGLCVDPDTEKAVKVAEYSARWKHGQNDQAAETSLPKRRRLVEGRLDEGNSSTLLPPAEVKSMADGYPSPEMSVPVGDDGEGDRESYLHDCRPGCNYSHMPRGAANARDTWAIDLGLRSHDNSESPPGRRQFP